MYKDFHIKAIANCQFPCSNPIYWNESKDHKNKAFLKLDQGCHHHYTHTHTHTWTLKFQLLYNIVSIVCVITAVGLSEICKHSLGHKMTKLGKNTEPKEQ